MPSGPRDTRRRRPFRHLKDIAASALPEHPLQEGPFDAFQPVPVGAGRLVAVIPGCHSRPAELPGAPTRPTGLDGRIGA